jgi:hypothetical protein
MRDSGINESNNAKKDALGLGSPPGSMPVAYSEDRKNNERVGLGRRSEHNL